LVCKDGAASITLVFSGSPEVKLTRKMGAGLRRTGLRRRGEKKDRPLAPELSPIQFGDRGRSGCIIACCLAPGQTDRAEKPDTPIAPVDFPGASRQRSESACLRQRHPQVL
jgi:hypothetical protein